MPIAVISFTELFAAFGTLSFSPAFQLMGVAKKKLSHNFFPHFSQVNSVSFFHFQEWTNILTVTVLKEIMITIVLLRMGPVSTHEQLSS